MFMAPARLVTGIAGWKLVAFRPLSILKQCASWLVINRRLWLTPAAKNTERILIKQRADAAFTLAHS
jgi:hypothetical protein